MIATLSHHGRTLVSALALMAAAIAMGWIFNADHDASSLAKEIPLPGLPSAPEKKPLARAAAFTAIAERPLFSPSRRPVPPATQPSVSAAPVQQQPPPMLSATLVGIIISPEGNLAIVRRADGTTKTVIEGERFDGWELTGVMQDQAHFSYGAATVELTFPIHSPSANGVMASTTPGAAVRRRR